MNFPMHLILIQDSDNPKKFIADQSDATLHLFENHDLLSAHCKTALPEQKTLPLEIVNLSALRQLIAPPRLSDFQAVCIHHWDGKTECHSIPEFLIRMESQQN
jgi:hypothetical protein